MPNKDKKGIIIVVAKTIIELNPTSEKDCKSSGEDWDASNPTETKASKTGAAISMENLANPFQLLYL